MRYVSMAATLAGIICLGLVAFNQPSAAQNAAEWGTIKGRIVWEGEVPKRKAVAVNKDKAHCLAKGEVLSDELVVNPKNKGVRAVFVWLTTDPENKKTIPIHPSLKVIKNKEVVMDQPHCRFTPHSLGMREGQILVAKNGSPIAHNFNYAGHPIRNPGRNFLMAPKSTVPIKGLKADDKFPVIVSCNIHGWMKAYVRVFSHPYFAVTDVNGNFEIKDAPKGDWRLKVWYDGGWRGGAKGRDGAKITVKGGAVNDLGTLKLNP